MLRCAVVGATGYTGIELIKILLCHPRVEVTALTTRQEKPIPVRDLIPTLPRQYDFTIRQHSIAEIKAAADIVFLCLPHTEAAQSAASFYKAGKIVIDLSADLRLRNWKLYEEWYGVRHPERKLLKHSVYGLPEFYRKEIRKTDLIANPGCYPTVSILSLLPLLKERLIEPDSIVIDAKSGVSGAGKKAKESTLFCEVEEDFYAYKVGKHQHTPEINQCLSDAAGRAIHTTFTAHLLPVKRGILATVYGKAQKGIKAQSIREAFIKTYQREPFVRITKEGFFPALKAVQQTNYCDIGIHYEPRTRQVIVIGAIDNLLKGASGQAVQNMNIRCGLAEEEGLNLW